MEYKILLYKSKKLKDGRHPIMIKIKKNSKTRLISIGDTRCKAFPFQWDEKQNLFIADEKINPDYLELNYKILDKVARIKKDPEQFLEPKTTEGLPILKKNKETKKSGVKFVNFIKKHAAELEEDKRYGSANNYLRLIKDFENVFGEAQVKKLDLVDINVENCNTLIQYGQEKIMQKEGINQRWNNGYIFNKLSLIRAVLNEAINQKLIPNTSYPFTTDKSTKGLININTYKAQNVNKFIPEYYLNTFKNYKCIEYENMLYIKLFLFLKESSLKFNDILSLKTTEAILQFQEYPKLMSIIKWLKNNNDENEELLFPLKKLRPDDTIKQLRRRKDNIIAYAEKKVKKKLLRKYDFNVINEIIIYNLNDLLAQQLFLFSYYAQGMNMKDMALLRKNDIKQRFNDKGEIIEYISYTRSKTGCKIEVVISDKLKQIITTLQAQFTTIDDYLLPIIKTKSSNPKTIEKAIDDQRKNINPYLKRLAIACNFPSILQDLHMYYARHTYATSMRLNGASIELISEALGHKHISTTQIYLDSFGSTKIHDYNTLL